MVRVKICGIRSYEEARLVLDAGVDTLGFVFARSPRQVNPETAREIIMKLPPFTTTVGVFVNEPRYSLMEIASFCRLDVLQLHGDEPPEYCHGLSQRVIKAFRVRDASFIQAMDSYPEVQGFLLDAYVPGVAGGSGRTFNWELAKDAVARGRPIILAGGLTPENVSTAIRTVRPYAVDVASGVETNGRKDPVKIVSFLRAVREAEEQVSRPATASPLAKR
ncbi:phosphoribosylanthranilate isomerase [Neomoorella mulderi]|uniref:N-(5'-phosphoribosyl)anthranilate isomerase n=1 Tax=Moorella mulderi DSM 14980 TaxID=1122241 RepID=A0A151AZE9_9FIRM|nr:phosphoribosylanthranilate isomerase [Moorella mulderi]KYH33035.1 N-(5'-phosphoribosyl)anthranilate isomerase [Moorella mulderi DSM 14980]